MKISFLVGNLKFFNSYAFIYPIYNSMNFLKNNDIISIHYTTNNNNYDVTFLDSKYFYDLFASQNYDVIFKILKDIKQKCKILVYCDNEASLFINSKIYPYVDFYLKSKLPKNKDYYKNKYYGLRSFTDFYYNKFNVKDKNEVYSDVISEEYVTKNILGWNNGICDYSLYSHIKRKLFSYSKIKLLLNFTSKNVKKTNNISGRIIQNYNRKSVAFQREYIIKNFSRSFETKRIKKREYFKELEDSRVSLSPFGWGEICYRDFEIFLSKSMLLKPSMDHIITWPNYYVDKSTYLKFEWDFSDFEKVLNKIEDKTYCLNISEKGHNYFMSFFSTSGKVKFCDYFQTILNSITN